MPNPEYTPLDPKTVLNAVQAPSMPFGWSVNPYRGCQHGCSFCYARNTHAYLGETADDTFQRRIYWKRNAPDVLRRQLRRMSRLPEHVAIGTATDPYQPLEAQTRLTRGCLEVFAEFGVPVSVTTRSPLILRDLDLLRRMRVVSVNISLHTLDRRIWREFEPSTPPPQARLRAMARLAEAGIPVEAFMAPILPHLTDSAESAEALAAAFREAGARRAMASFLRLSTPEVKAWFFSVLGRAYPHLVPVYGEMYWKSAYAPAEYRKRVGRRIEAALARHGFPPACREERPRPAPAEEAPVQLTLF